jgi:hypothetical protein
MIAAFLLYSDILDEFGAFVGCMALASQRHTTNECPNRVIFNLKTS